MTRDTLSTGGFNLKGLRASVSKAVETERIHRDVCKGGSACVITAVSRRKDMLLGGKPYRMVFCEVCGVGRQDVP